MKYLNAGLGAFLHISAHFVSVITGIPGKRYHRTPWLVLPQEDKRVTVFKETVVLCQWGVETNVWFIKKRMKDQIKERSSQLVRNLSSCEKKS